MFYIVIGYAVLMDSIEVVGDFFVFLIVGRKI